MESFHKLSQGSKTILTVPRWAMHGFESQRIPRRKFAIVDHAYAEGGLPNLTSAMKNVDVAVYNYLKIVTDGFVRAVITTGALQNGGVGLAPFHDWEGRNPADLKARIQKASDGIQDGSFRVPIEARGPRQRRVSQA